MTTTKAEWIKSEDAGYLPGTLLLDTAGGGHWSVYKAKSRWLAVYVENSIGRSVQSFRTRREAMAHAESGR